MILITGATGFLGHNLVPRLINEGHKLRALVRPTSDTRFLEELGVELAYADDISDTTAVASACQGCDRVIHAAGLFRFWGDDEEFHRTNVAGTRAVLEAAVAANVQKVIHISTVVVVGKVPAKNNNPQHEINETTPCNPQDPYQRTKLAAERLALQYHHDHDLPVVVLRPGAFYGPWGSYAFNRLFFEEPLKGWRIKVNGGRYITFPVYVPDVAQAILLGLKKGVAGEVYNICSQSLNHNEANDIVSDTAGISRWRMNFPIWVALTLARVLTAVSTITKREPFYPTNMAPYVFQNWVVSTRKAEEQLGFQPTPFAEGVKTTLEWYWAQGLLKK